MPATNLPDPLRILSQNIVVAGGDHNEPTVETTAQTVSVQNIPGFEGRLRRGVVANSTFPAINDSILDDSIDPGSGIVHHGGSKIYYLDMAPGSTTPMHRTVSLDYMIVLDGSPTLVTPEGNFSVVDGKANYTDTIDTVILKGSIVVQRGQYHAWENRSNDWVRFVAVVIDAQPQTVQTPSGEVVLGESWL